MGMDLECTKLSKISEERQISNALLWNFRKKSDEQSWGVMREADKEVDSTLENKLSVAPGQGRGGKG